MPTTTSTTTAYHNDNLGEEGFKTVLIPIIIVASIVGLSCLAGIVTACICCWGSICNCFRAPPPPVTPMHATPYTPPQHVAFATATTSTPYSPNSGYYANPSSAPHGQHHLIAHQQHQLQHNHLIAHQQHQLQQQQHQQHHQQHHHHHHQQPVYTHGGYPSQPQTYVVTQPQLGAINGSYEMSPITRL